jgi:hypothetical protein
VIVGRTTFDVAGAAMRSDAAEALSDALEYLLEESNRTIPIEEHIMEGSGTVTVDRANLVGSVSYDTPYTRVQHENLQFRHDPGRRAKWLERTWAEQSGRVGAYLADRLKRRQS